MSNPAFEIVCAGLMILALAVGWAVSRPTSIFYAALLSAVGIGLIFIALRSEKKSDGRLTPGGDDG